MNGLDTEIGELSYLIINKNATNAFSKFNDYYQIASAKNRENIRHNFDCRSPSFARLVVQPAAADVLRNVGLLMNRGGHACVCVVKVIVLAYSRIESIAYALS